MPVESPEERTVEVLALPEAVDEELLFLYFENKRRSGGGPLVSVEKKGDNAVLVFEEAEGKWKHGVFVWALLVGEGGIFTVYFLAFQTTSRTQIKVLICH